MEVLVRNAEGNLSVEDREYAAQKLGRLDRFFNSAQRVEIVHREDKHGHHRIEVTVFADGFTVRGEETDGSIRAAIDVVSEKLDQRLRRLKRRMHDSHQRRGSQIPQGLADSPADSDDHAVVISEHKHFLISPMSVEEAALQMDMVSHPFFVFRNEHSNMVEVIYKRKDGKYGLLHPEG